MARIGLFFGSTGGNTKDVAKLIQTKLGRDAVDVVDVASASPEQVEEYDYLIFGVSTYGMGSLQEDWADFIWELDDVDLAGKKVALFCLGDQKDYPESFVDAMKELYDKVLERGGAVVCPWPTDGYTFDKSAAVVDGRFVGLAIDEDRQKDLTEQRVSEWVKQVREEFA